MRIFLICAALLFAQSCTEESRLKDEAKSAVAEMLHDPQSAQFSHVSVPHPGVVCGFVNGKNLFGAYTGLQSFVYIGTIASKRRPEDGGPYINGIARSRPLHGRLVVVDFARDIMPYCD